MNRVASGALWLAGAAIGAAAIFVVLGVFARLDHQMWMVFALAIILGLVVGWWPRVTPAVRWSLAGFYMAAYVASLGGGRLFAFDSTVMSPRLRALALHCQETAAVVAAAFLVALVVLAFSHRKKSPWATTWFAMVVICSGLVAVFSGPRGAPGGAAEWLASWMHVDMGTAESIVHYGRKAIHFGFYGCFAWFTLRAAKGAGATVAGAVASAFGLVLCHACIDEWRQLSSVGRTGSAWDVLLDFAGMAVFVILATRGNSAARRATT